MQIWITVIVGMFVGYGLMLLTGWIIIEVMSRTLSLSDFARFLDEKDLIGVKPHPFRR